MSMLTTPPPISRGKMREDLGGLLMTAIFRGEFRGGDRLVVSKLTVRFGVSATPVREAIFELAHFGLVTLTPNCGAVVNPFGPVQVRELYHLRRVLECEATRCACGRIDHGELRDLDQEISELEIGTRKSARWLERAEDTDRQLHSLIAVSCGVQRLQNEIRRYELCVGRAIVGHLQAVQERAASEHRDIIRALLAEEPELAADAMGRHIQNTAVVVEATLFPNGELPEVKLYR